MGRYQIVRCIGRGGMGSVYEARHLELGKRVALKVLRADVAAQPGVRVAQTCQRDLGRAFVPRGAVRLLAATTDGGRP